MFERAVFHLTGPICNCNEQELGWRLENNRDLSIICESCKTTLKVPYGKLQARFQLATPYPADVAQVAPPTEPEIEVIIEEPEPSEKTVFDRLLQDDPIE